MLRLLERVVREFTAEPIDATLTYLRETRAGGHGCYVEKTVEGAARGWPAPSEAIVLCDRRAHEQYCGGLHRLERAGADHLGRGKAGMGPNTEYLFLTRHQKFMSPDFGLHDRRLRWTS